MSDEILTKRYSRALFEIASEESLLQRLSDELSLLAEAIKKNEEWVIMVQAPHFSKEEQRGILKDFFEKISIHRYLESLIKILVDRDILQTLPEIKEEFDELVRWKKGEIKVEVVVSNLETWDLLKDEIQETIEKATGKKIIAEAVVDTSIIGGITIRIDDKIYDGSVKGELKRLRETLIKSASDI